MLYHVIRIPFIALHSTHAAFQIRSGAMDSYTSSVTNKCLYSNTTCSIRIGNSEPQPFQEGCVKVLFSLTYTLTGRYDDIPRDESYLVSAIAIKSKMKLTFYKIVQFFLR